MADPTRLSEISPDVELLTLARGCHRITLVLVVPCLGAVGGIRAGSVIW